MRDDQHELLYRAFFESTAVLGVSARQALIEDLSQQGIDLHKTTVEELAVDLRRLLDNDSAALIIGKIVQKLDDWVFVNKNKKQKSFK